MEFSPAASVVIALLLALWVAAAAWALIAAGARIESAASARSAARRLARMIDEAPAVPMLVRADGRIEGPERLARWLGLDALPADLGQLAPEGDRGLSPDQLAALEEAVARTQATAAPFALTATLPGSDRALAFRGTLADPQVSPGGAALVWVFDSTDTHARLVAAEREAEEARADYAALSALIETAPVPMWFRRPDGRLRLVNVAYARAVGCEDAEAAARGQIELLEPSGDGTPSEAARAVFERGEAGDRTVGATIDGRRRALRVTEVPVPGEGVAGVALDVEEAERRARALRAFQDAQRSMLDRLSVGVAQFDAERKLVFANQPFRRSFAVAPGAVRSGTDFERLLTQAREQGRTPEVRDFPAWRAEHAAWFAAGDALEEDWSLPGGVHLRIVGQPMPDGGLVLVAEDRTREHALSAARDSLLRTRTATFDSLFEALAVFAPDGKLQLWNRRFAGVWGIEPDLLDGHPSAPEIVEAIAPHLADRRKAEGVGQIIRGATLDRREGAGRVALADGRTLELAGVPLPDGNGLLTVLDITDSQKVEDNLRQRAAALEAADEVKARFLANMSYEFRTPLTSIAGFAEMLEAGLAGELPEQANDYLAAIREATDRLTRAVEDGLDLTQGEAGLLPVNIGEVALLDLATQVVREREAAIGDADLSLELRGAKGLIAEADREQLSRALGHLVDNAIAASPPGGAIRVDVRRSGTGARLAVSDKGPGMDEDALRAATSGQGKRGGLGLALVRELAEAHGGRLEIASEPGEGTVTTIVLP